MQKCLKKNKGESEGSKDEEERNRGVMDTLDHIRPDELSKKLIRL